MELFPHIESFANGYLEVGDGHSLAWEVSGNPAGVPLLFLHGGPGAGTSPAYRRFFDPGFWRIILFDQRGCGRSTPNASLDANTTPHLIADIEKLRLHLGVERWLLFGGSWGSTLAIAYGQAHPDRVLGFVLRGIFLCRPREVEWFLHGMGRFFPEAAEHMTGHLDEAERADVLGAYYRRLTDPSPAIHMPAARVWCGYEEACARLLPTRSPPELDDRSCLALARIECHYLMHQGFFGPEQLLAGMPAIAHLPCAIVQGRYDVVCPPETALDLQRSWPGAEMALVPDGGHAAMEPSIRAHLVAAVEGMKARLRQGQGDKL